MWADLSEIAELFQVDAPAHHIERIEVWRAHNLARSTARWRGLPPIAKRMERRRGRVRDREIIRAIRASHVPWSPPPVGRSAELERRAQLSARRYTG